MPRFRLPHFALYLLALCPLSAFAGLFDMDAMRDPGTLAVETIDDWHLVEGAVPTRQKYITIRVGELWPGQDLRIPVRLIVPADRKARGFHLTGGNNLKRLSVDAPIQGVDADLIEGGVGLVRTIVQELRTYGEKELGDAMIAHFHETLNTRYSIQYWGWPAILMRATTAAYAETDYFETGKVAMSGGSKNGASPSVALIADTRLTAVHASVSPPWESPLRLCDDQAWSALKAYNRSDPEFEPHRFLGGTFGPRYNEEAIAAGHSWEDLKRLSHKVADHIFVSKNLSQLKERDVDLLFHPGTHDMVAFDLAWGGAHYPQIPTYLRINSGHGKRGRPESAETDEQNKAAFLMEHFFGGSETLLTAPTVSVERTGRGLKATVRFKDGESPETGRIWWMHDRAPDGSAAYNRELFPEDQWQDMKYDKARNEWSATIELESGANYIDFLSNHRKTLSYLGKSYTTYVSSPYTRVSVSE